jgi:DNA-binding transcriptional MocR family regulator
MGRVSLSRLLELLGDWRRGGPAQERLAATLRALVLDGQIPPQTVLPAQRALASALGVSRTTVNAAYDRLRADGYLASRPGSGSWTTIPGGHGAARDALVPTDAIDMQVAALPAPPLLDEIAREAVAQLPRWLDHHGYEPLGLPPLREAIAARFEARGLPTRPEQILVTNGALHALDLAIRGTELRGRTALVELPTYPAALDALRAAGARLRAMPVSAAGWDLEATGGLAGSSQVAFAYLIPDFQNPTGALIDEVSRRRALHWLSRGEAHVVIDETFAELSLDGRALPRPMAAAGVGRTLTIGSLGKAVWGGLRVGWVRADPELIRRLAAVRAIADLASPVLEQIIATEVLSRLDEILGERRALALRHQDALSRALATHLPDWSYVAPRGGLFIWARIPDPISTRLAVLAREHGLHLTAGPRFGAAGMLERFIRLPFTAPPDQLERAVRTLSVLAPQVSGSTKIDTHVSYVA